ncbi:MAG: CatB-related O-acetyltransferase [Lachnospiraceae bacterium]|nr:CatB-related O-acetyltransferase [Lachnospiraceae bacterium]
MKQGSYLNKGSKLCGNNYIGRDTLLSNTVVGYGSYVNKGCDISNTRIGKYTSIGSRVTTELGSHPLDGKHIALHPCFYSSGGELGYTYSTQNSYEEQKYIDKKQRVQVVIGNDVWIGNNVSILEGVTIGDGAVIAAGAVVTKNAEPYGIYAGVPAVKLRSRFEEDKIAKLLSVKWWDKDVKEIKKLAAEGFFSDIDNIDRDDH